MRQPSGWGDGHHRLLLLLVLGLPRESDNEALGD
jgi:hypothetical protein